jgi:hypothetical protein
VPWDEFSDSPHDGTQGNRSPTDRGVTGVTQLDAARAGGGGLEAPEQKTPHKDPEARGCTAHPKLSNGTLNPPPRKQPKHAYSGRIQFATGQTCPRTPAYRTAKSTVTAQLPRQIQTRRRQIHLSTRPDPSPSRANSTPGHAILQPSPAFQRKSRPPRSGDPFWEIHHAGHHRNRSRTRPTGRYRVLRDDHSRAQRTSGGASGERTRAWRRVWWPSSPGAGARVARERSSPSLASSGT